MVNNKEKIQLLSPAGDIEAGYAALHYGADAVYLGLPKFSARAGAVNFQEEELSSFTGFAHSEGKKVFLALNTLICEREKSAVLDILAFAEEIGIDSVIVQDIGLGRLVRKHFPSLRLHGSTQMAVHNRAGAEALRDMGFKRVVLARELTLEEIREISNLEGIETEVFIHGALCYCYSGLCLFSSLTSGRSANRGRCLYPCRKAYSSEGTSSSHLFSMKDLAQKEEVLKLLGTNVSALKIEGRKKNALYVAAVTDFYRNLVDTGIKSAEKEKNMQMIFARPWTHLYLNSRKNQDVTDNDFVGHRGLFTGVLAKLSVKDGADYIQIVPVVSIGLHDGIQIDVPGSEKPYGFAIESMQDGKSRPRMTAEAGKAIWLKLPADHPYIPERSAIYISSSSGVKGAYGYPKPKASLYKKRTPIDVTLTVSEDRVIAESSLGGKAELAEHFSPATHKGALREAAFTAFAKTGDTPFVLNEFSYTNPNELFVPVSLLNDLRRQVYMQSSLPPAKQISLSYPDFPAQSRHYILKTDNVSSLAELSTEDAAGIFEVIVSGSIADIDSAAAQFGQDKIRISLPPLCRYWENDKTAYFIRTMLNKGYKKWEISNVGALKMLPLADIDFTADWSLYVINRESAAELLDLKASRFTLSPEDSLENITKITKSFGAYSTFIMYQDTPLFISETDTGEGNCQPLRSSDGSFCKLTKDGRTYVIGERPLCLAAGAKETGAAFLRADFILRPYKASEVADIWRTLVAGKDVKDSVQGNFTRGF